MKAFLPFAILISPGFAGPAFAEKRVALVIGNSAYQNVTAQDNPAKDAALMADTLKDLGFAITGDRAQRQKGHRPDGQSSTAKQRRQQKGALGSHVATAIR